jgi:homoserine kinase type II
VTKSPELAMLWESGDPHAALVKRFGFTDVGKAAQWLAATLASNWGIEMLSCERLVISGGNALAWVVADTGPLIAKWSIVSRLYPRLAESARLTAWLGGRGLPVSAPLPTLHGSVQVEVGGVSMGVQSVVDGALLDVADLDQVHSAGVVLANLHLALAEYPDVDRITAVTGQRAPEPLIARIARWLDSMSHDRHSVAIEALRECLAARQSDNALPAQLVHNDFRSANVLCTGPRINAVIDFEEVRVDYRVLDLAHAAVMLATQFRNWGPASPEAQEVFLAAYRSIHPLSPSEDAWLRVLMLWRTLGNVPVGEDPTGWARSAKRQIAGW